MFRQEEDCMEAVEGLPDVCVHRFARIASLQLRHSSISFCQVL